ncbi:MAG TPA: helix-turn-helix domain-containing protein [Flavisolibacter sp.]|nr:helix-turn-helix domain-containing protein [Flavisolibacter sp.]
MVNLLEEKINYYAAIGTLMLLNEPEKNELKHMIMHAQKEAYVSFHLRSMILKFVATTLHKIRASDLAISQDRGNYIPFDDVECYLNQHKLKNLPDLKCLAQKFCISESTLKRQFKKHYGVSMSDYFYKLKFGYAEQLMRSKGITCSEAGQLIGYKNMQHFSQMFNKYYKSHSPYNEV